MRICSFKGCDLKHRRNGYCATHSTRYFRHGDPTIIKKRDYGYTSDGERKAAIKQSQRIYDKTPKGRVASVLKRHRRRSKGGDVKLTTHQALSVFKVFSNQCFKCKTIKDLTLDHHIPLNAGGLLELGNCSILCRKCNGQKADLLPNEFYSSEELEVLAGLLSLTSG